MPAKVYRDWINIRQKVLEPAIAEVNQIADFVASYRVETGPRNKVVGWSWWRAEIRPEVNRVISIK